MKNRLILLLILKLLNSTDSHKRKMNDDTFSPAEKKIRVSETNHAELYQSIDFYCKNDFYCSTPTELQAKTISNNNTAHLFATSDKLYILTNSEMDACNGLLKLQESFSDPNKQGKKDNKNDRFSGPAICIKGDKNMKETRNYVTISLKSDRGDIKIKKFASNDSVKLSELIIEFGKIPTLNFKYLINFIYKNEKTDLTIDIEEQSFDILVQKFFNDYIIYSEVEELFDKNSNSIGTFKTLLEDFYEFQRSFGKVLTSNIHNKMS